MYNATLNTFTQQSCSFLSQRMHHHSELDMRALIRANTLLLDPVLVCSLRSFTRDINSVAIVHYVSWCMLDTVIFSCGHYGMIFPIFVREDN
jgi:hypothetical protein